MEALPYICPLNTSDLKLSITWLVFVLLIGKDRKKNFLEMEKPIFFVRIFLYNLFVKVSKPWDLFLLVKLPWPFYHYF